MPEDDEPKLIIREVMENDRRIVSRNILDTGEPMPEPQQRKVTMPQFRAGGRSYSYLGVVNCKTCQIMPRELRDEVDIHLINGYAARTIIDNLLPDRDISVEALREHGKNHLPLDAAMRRAIVEASAEKVNGALEELEGSMVNQVSFARIGLQQVFEMMQSGELSPTLDHGISWMNFLQRLDEYDESQADHQQYIAMFDIWWESIAEVVTEEQRQAIGHKITSHPGLAALKRQSERKTALTAASEELPPGK